MIDWQPTETAPENELLLVTSSRGPVVAERIGSEWFINGVDYENGFSMWPKPTHWMPLPEMSQGS